MSEEVMKTTEEDRIYLLEDYESLGEFASFGAWNADHRSIGHSGMRQESRLQLGWRDLQALVLNQLLHSAAIRRGG